MTQFRRLSIPEAINHLKMLRRARCCYLPPASDGFCDCKYDGDLSNRAPIGEQTGCPEIRSIIQLLEGLEDETL